MSRKAGCVYLSSAWFQAIFCLYGCIAVIGECVHGVQRLHFGDDCHRYHRRRPLWFSFVVIFIVVIIVIIICHHHPSCGSWKLDHAIVFESRPLAAASVSRSIVVVVLVFDTLSLSSHAVCFWVGRAPRLSLVASTNGLNVTLVENHF